MNAPASTITQPFEYHGKRVLITQRALADLAGSEMVVYELADFLLTQGAKPTIYTYYFSEPIGACFEEAGLSVIDSDNTKLKWQDFDYVWVQHQVLPKSLVDQLAKPIPGRPSVVFHHMSVLGQVPIERPYIWDLENRLSSLSLFCSSEVRDGLSSMLRADVPLALFPNPAPMEFTGVPEVPAGTLRRIAIVSNHPPDELKQAKELLTAQGIDVVSFGRHQDRHSLMTADVIRGFDAVITIGKTVQYCLVSGIPVYVYDHFGGPGWLNDSVFPDAEYANFSGRGFARRDPSAITTEITEGVRSAAAFQSEHRDQFISTYSIATALPRVLESASANVRPFGQFSPQYVAYLAGQHSLARQMIRQTFQLKQSVTRRDIQLADLAQDIQTLQDDAASQRQRADSIMQSQSYRLGDAIIKPLSLIKSALTNRQAAKS